MRVLAAEQPGGPNQLRLRELAEPPLTDHQVRIRVRAIGMNFAELVQVSRGFQIPAPDPIVPGFEASGTIVEVGDGVEALAVGQRVMALVAWGAYTDTLTVDAAHALPVPDDMDDLVAGAFPVSYATAHVSLIHRGRLSSGETVVITGVPGNVGSAALEVARAKGARTIALDRFGDLSHNVADHIVPIKEAADGIRDLTDGRGADVALDLVGGDVTSDLLASLSWEGRLVSTGFASGTIPTVNLLEVLIGGLTILGEDIAGYAARDIAVPRAALEECIGWRSEGKITPVVPNTHPFEDAASTLAAIGDGTLVGKQALELRD